MGNTRFMGRRSGPNSAAADTKRQNIITGVWFFGFVWFVHKHWEKSSDMDNLALLRLVEGKLQIVLLQSIF